MGCNHSRVLAFRIYDKQTLARTERLNGKHRDGFDIFSQVSAIMRSAVSYSSAVEMSGLHTDERYKGRIG